MMSCEVLLSHGQSLSMSYKDSITRRIPVAGGRNADVRQMVIQLNRFQGLSATKISNNNDHKNPQSNLPFTITILTR